MSLFDISGAQVLEIPSKEARVSQPSETVISLEQIPAGVYFVRVSSQDGAQTQKLIVVK